MICAGIAALQPCAAQTALSALEAQVRLLDKAALERMAGDWAATWGDSADVAKVRSFAEELDSGRGEALEALRRGDETPARALLARHRRTVARHPLVRDLTIVALRHRVSAKHARVDRHPAAPGRAAPRR